MEFPTIDKFAKDVAEKALDEFIYEGKTIREWVEIIAKQEPCEDCISRQVAINALGECPMVWTDSDAEITAERDWKDTVKMLKSLPSVTPQPKVGRWIDIQYFKADETYYRPKCPFCSIEPKEYSNYCPSCGAKMEVEE